jgi:uncharacterized membrane protein YeiB
MGDRAGALERVTGAAAPPAERVVGYDVARSLAVLGMVVVHFSLVGAAGRSEPPWLAWILAHLDGRASATFVVLAGVGITLVSARARRDRDAMTLTAVRRVLSRRGGFLLAVGFVNLLIWPGDILRVYGVSFLVASRLILAPARLLLGLAVAFALAFAALVFVGDFETNWEWQTLTYRGLWAPSGVFRNLFFDGFRSVLPWTGFVLFGMWLGRLDLTDRRTNGRVLFAAAAVALAAEAASGLLVSYFLAHPVGGLDGETVTAVFGTESMPALPLFLLAAGGTATAVIALCVRVGSSWPGRAWQPLAATGRMALTWYFAHILLGLGALVAFGLVGTQPLPVAAGYGLLFFGAAVILSCVWAGSFRQGPLEWVMRATAG